ncbi:hypothetical protein SAMN02745163_02853 [Clostridium cavendishii DSM 21758]|uniref:Metallo-beta-lactamase superfamily protein n=1 Tax=Clostridium cavendishii DSM 21758 TaxID=1121302 RepID=A0A1M6NB95_9CLOT|nr:hypothetical protein [Clostridium cavendishii]SHJ93000.1 hypothetical protein SAMN02745163_02853 [Clostridium cavendishii DSM 21758]
MYLPDFVFENELYFSEDKIKLFHIPGHTIDLISVLDEEDNVLLVGDNIRKIILNAYCKKMSILIL